MISTGTEELKKIFEEYKNIITIYGEAGTGKTTLCLLAAIEQASNNKKVLFLDTEKNFSLERVWQLLTNNDKDCVKNILVLKLNNFNLQHTQIKNLENIKNVSLIVIDSITNHYRRLYGREPELAKGMLGKQLSVLNKISKNNVPVMITSQVYSDLKDSINPLGKEILKRASNKIIRLEKNPRKIIFEKPEKKGLYFDILNEGIKIK